LTKEQKEGLPQQMIDTALDNKKFKTEIMLARKDGTKIWASVVLETVNSPTGELNGFAVIIQDISDLRLMELERNRLIAIIDESTDFIGMADLEDHLLYHNRGAKKMIGLPLDYDMSNMTVKDMHPAWAYNKINNVIMPIVLNQGSWSGESALVHQQTKIEIPVLQTIILHRDTQGNPLYLTTMMRDITERKNYEKALKHSEEIFRSAMEHAAIGMALVSVEGRWLKVNESLCHIFGFSEMDLLNNNFQAIAHQDDIKLDLDHIAQLLSGSISSYEVEKRYIRKDGATIWILLSVSLLRDVDNKPLYFIMQFQDIDSQKKAEEELKYFAYHDVLTGLANRKQLEAAFEMALTYAQRHNTYIAILFLDLDNFKEINDQHGHEIGDLLLLEVAARLRATVRASDILVRLGGDEFVIALTELADKQQAISVAKKIIDAITVPMTLKEHKIQVTASIGISLYPEDAQELKTLLKHADKALYSVKAEGKNNFGSFSR